MKKFVLACALIAAAAPAFAQDTPDFGKVDTDGNSMITPVEMRVMRPEMTDAQWTMMDTDKSGDLNRGEFDAMIKSGM